jgi:serine/threonine-protein kinase
MEAGPLRVSDALDLAIQTARGLNEAHRHAIVHRDIKPSNILLSNSGAVKIVDFGLAKQPGQTELTRTGTTVGTPAYMSPEQVRGDEVDSRTDVWSVGVTLYEMLAGTQPFKGGTPGAIANAILGAEPKRVEAIRPDVPPALADVVRNALAKNRDDRYADAAALLKELTHVQESLSAASVPAGSLHPLARTLRKPAVWIPAAMALVIGGVVLGSIAYTQSQVRWARQELIKETLAWLDQHLGPVNLKPVK